MSYTRDEVAYLATHRTQLDALAPQLGLTAASALKDASRAREACGDYGRAALELLSARIKATGKIPASWLCDETSVQQATPLAVADVRAQRIANYAPTGLVHDVTCSIGTEGRALTAAGLRYLGSDLDPIRARMAAHNLPTQPILVADALVPVARGADVIVADPARRAGGRRISDPAQLHPPLPALLTAWSGSELAVKCAPGIDYSGWDGLVSIVSVSGGVKEACLYTAGLSTAGERREAVILSPRGTDRLTDKDPDAPAEDLSGPVREYIVDPDGAIVRAGLVTTYAVRESLTMLDPHIAYLTGNHIPDGTSGFPVLEAVSLKRLKAALQAYNCGSLEILVRGVQIDPDALRKKLKLRGDRPLAVVIARVGTNAIAYVCESRRTAA